MPSNGAAALGYGFEASGWWSKYAAGIYVPLEGYITSINVAITPARGSMFNTYGSLRGFVLGIADNTLPNIPTPEENRGKPQGSLWKTGRVFHNASPPRSPASLHMGQRRSWT